MQSSKCEDLFSVVWRKDEDVVQKLLTDFAQGSRWVKGCSRWVERRAGGEEKGRGERWMWLSGRVTARLQVLFGLFMSCRRFTPLSPLPLSLLSHFSSPSFPLLLLHSPLQLAPLFFQYFLSACRWLPCPLHALWLWFSLSFTLLLLLISPALFK